MSGKQQNAPLFTYHQLWWGADVDFEAAELEKLVAAGFVQDYMLEQLGNQSSRQGPTDNGDRFVLKRLPSGRYKLQLFLNVDPDTSSLGYHCQFGIDISDILARITVKGGAA